jgi:methylated-DNA-[protein]-cysteine S-methyltransferase
MSPVGYVMFDTAIGPCGIAWSARGIVAVQLPEATERETRARLIRRLPQAQEASPPAAVRRARDGIAALLRGEPADFGGVALDLEGVPAFHRRVYTIARTIAPGTTRSYGEIAARLGAPRAARAVGQALGNNPVPILVPCHRVVAARGRPGGFSAHGGIATKLRLLAIETGANGMPARS